METTNKEHTKDSDCTVSEETHCCIECGVSHDGYCPECGGQAFHVEGCSEIEAQD